MTRIARTGHVLILLAIIATSASHALGQSGSPNAPPEPWYALSNWLTFVLRYVLLPLMLSLAMLWIGLQLNRRRRRWILGGRAENARKLAADGLFEDALREFGELLKEVSPKHDACFFMRLKDAEAQCYVGMAAKKDKEINLLKALRSLEMAQMVCKGSHLELEAAGILSHQGAVYGQLAEVRNREANLLQAKSALEKVLGIFTAEASPLAYAAAESNRGNVYVALSDLGEKEANLDLAVKAFHAALQVYTRERSRRNMPVRSVVWQGPTRDCRKFETKRRISGRPLG